MKLTIVVLSLLVVVGMLLGAEAVDAEEPGNDAPVAGTRRWCACVLGLCYCRNKATAGRDERSMTDDIKTYKDAGYNGETGETRGWCACLGRACYCRRRSRQLSDNDEAKLDMSLTEAESLQAQERGVDDKDAKKDSNNGDLDVGTRRWCACVLGMCYCRNKAVERRILDERRADAVDPIQTYEDASYNGEVGATRGWCACFGRACYCRN